ncbi:N-acetyltransferase [Aggregicoccus sp. 17bor-14]|uniref:GNAT family N-acetyltransferase n=1 Tax=Myxococcaceae TaxID=31 RepID=UPI00129C94D3|nr:MULTISPECIES: GNAT family N-acetyltransferase [Myxococcaceae]MBF5046259.1 N-acetyltransferase [Simulacricoccus sp. 17bor-14]MRI91982.1 N-acetyltransferase [Aggregicoccus sp. 17bor-14]
MTKQGLPSLAAAAPETPRLRLLAGIREVPAATWDALVGADAPPFLRHAWLLALEESGSASSETGWEPMHHTLWRGEQLVAAAPAYRKFHSMGEYIYDFGWAGAASRLGIEYYPKLLVGVPLSPATAPRLLVAAGEDVPALQDALAQALRASAEEEGLSGLHVIFPPEAEAARLEAHGLARRLTLQYHWRNPGYATYADYLSRFDSKRRAQLKRERAAAGFQGITIRTVKGEELTAAHARLAYDFYESTNEKHSWGQIQLNRDFFLRVFRTMRDAVELVVAEREGRVIAGAFNVASRTRLYGRYWGALEEHPFLHFNVCLYHSVDECIQQGREAFEPGAGGEHKISRGFLPTGIHSAHLIHDRRLDNAVRASLIHEREHLQRAVDEAEEIAGMKPWPLAPAGNAKK